MTTALQPIYLDAGKGKVRIIDQRRLPHELVWVDLTDENQAIAAIRDMLVRGAPLIGVTGGYAMALAALSGPRPLTDHWLIDTAGRLKAARPTAVNLAWAVDRVLAAMLAAPTDARRQATALDTACAIEAEEVANCRAIGRHGLPLIQALARQKKNGDRVNILTHCNAGWLACVAYGTATAPIYAAFDAGIDIHVWVDETRPLNQGARLTAWELGRHGVAHTVITDNAGGHLMQHGLVDMAIVGTDRTTITGDVANKVGTYLKALAAKDNGIPFYVALPSSTFDWHLRDGIRQIPIEQRDPDEVRWVDGWDDGPRRVLVPPVDSPAANYAFDVTPARLVTGFITERGVCAATEAAIRGLFPEK